MASIRETKASSKTTEIGSDKVCPMMSIYHCLDNCEWNDGEGCAIWRIVKALEGLRNKLDLYGLGRADAK